MKIKFLTFFIPLENLTLRKGKLLPVFSKPIQFKQKQNFHRCSSFMSHHELKIGVNWGNLRISSENKILS